LPLNEWVSRCCKARTLSHRPACVACTIRAWGRRTSRSTCRHWMACQSVGCEGPHQEPRRPLFSGSCVGHSRHLLRPLSLVAKLSRAERPDGSLLAFARGDVADRLNPYPVHYRRAFAFSILIYPLLHQLPLQVAFPLGKQWAYYVPYKYLMGWAPRVRRRPFACGREVQKPLHRPPTFWFKPLSIFGLSTVTTFISGSPGLARSINPSSRPSRCWQSSWPLTASGSLVRARLRCPMGFAPLNCFNRTPR
jgi:hypothetical protein